MLIHRFLPLIILSLLINNQSYAMLRSVAQSRATPRTLYNTIASYPRHIHLTPQKKTQFTIGDIILLGSIVATPCFIIDDMISEAKKPIKPEYTGYDQFELDDDGL